MKVKWKPDVIDAVWEHGRVMSEADSDTWRQDGCGAWMRRDEFGREDAEFGWKIENVSAGGPNVPENLRPFNLANGYDIANDRPHCRITADRTDNPAGQYSLPPRNRPV